MCLTSNWKQLKLLVLQNEVGLTPRHANTSICNDGTSHHDGSDTASPCLQRCLYIYVHQCWQDVEGGFDLPSLARVQDTLWNSCWRGFADAYASHELTDESSAIVHINIALASMSFPCVPFSLLAYIFISKLGHDSDWPRQFGLCHSI